MFTNQDGLHRSSSRGRAPQCPMDSWWRQRCLWVPAGWCSGPLHWSSRPTGESASGKANSWMSRNYEKCCNLTCPSPITSTVKGLSLTSLPPRLTCALYSPGTGGTHATEHVPSLLSWILMFDLAGPSIDTLSSCNEKYEIMSFVDA